MQDDDRNDDEDDERASSFISTFIVHRSSVRYRGGVFIEGASLSRGVMIILNRAYDLTNTTENIPKAKRNESINQN